ncbi:hypothetical protein Clacol_000955 [Clathrus columnatus]|uniref:DUF6534 domain-containing protein n=1 Tax=Clathrus columnatus TaxID=1419009 RepID=A0AAV5A1Z7_9AGAM|nr:hypothetical protein Clacol_000955 [Clathrus columnatus]
MMGHMATPPFLVSFGPMLIGVFLNAILYGVGGSISHETTDSRVVMNLFRLSFISKIANVPRDARWIRYLILYLFICETINTVCDIGMIYEPLVARFGTERAVTRTPILFTAVGGVGVTVYNGQIPKFTQLADSRWAVSLWLISSTVSDISITICLVWSLVRLTASMLIMSDLDQKKCRTGVERTDNVINRNIRFAIHTGALTSLFTLLDFVIFQAATNTSTNFAFDFALAKLYTNSLLSTFNARALSKNDKSEYNVLFGSPETQLLSPTKTAPLSTNFSLGNSLESVLVV